MDAWMVAAVGHEIDVSCRDARVQRVSQPQPHDVVLQLYGGGGSRYLLLSAHPSLCRVHFVPARPPALPAPPAFCQCLRRHLEGARLRACVQPGLERVLELVLEGRDELGNPRALRLVAELTGRLANLILVGEDGRILDALHRTGAEVNRRRQLLPGQPYLPPPRPPDRLDPVLLLRRFGPEGTGQAVRQAIAARPPDEPPERRLSLAVFGLTPVLADAICTWAAGHPGAPGGDGHAGAPGAAGVASRPADPGPAARTVDPELAQVPEVPEAPQVPEVSEVSEVSGVSEATPMATAAPDDAAAAHPETGPRACAGTAGAPDDAALARAVTALARSVVEGRFRPCLLRVPGRPPMPAAWPLPGWEVEAADSASDACRQASQAEEERLREQGLRQRLGDALRAAADRVRRRLAKQEEEQRQAQAAEAHRLAGQLLLAFGHLVPRGAAVAELPSFEDPGRTVRLQLDPALSAAANAQRLLRRYQKAQRAQREVAARLQAGRDELRYLEEAALALEQAEGLPELVALEAELQAQGVVAVVREANPAGHRPSGALRSGPGPGATARPAGPRRGGPGAPAAAPPLEFLAPGGWRILVGRNAAGNDHLTMRLARPDDLWLHARQMPGSHVLLRAPAGVGGAEPPEEAVLAAARCAAHYSAGRGAARVPVDCTARRHVWKPAGARPGFVRYERERTLLVSPDDLPPRAPDTPQGQPA